jgi:hypothetical protein
MSNLIYAPFGEDIPMTLQVVLGGNDGLLIATDLKKLTQPNAPLLRGDQRGALETGMVRSGEYGAEKIIFNAGKTVALACSGSDITFEIANKIIGLIESHWGEYIRPIEELCLREWNNLPQEQVDFANARSENALIAAHCGRRESFKILFEKSGPRVVLHCHRKSQKFVILGGDICNPAGMILERYLPSNPPSIVMLRFLAAHFILMGGKFNPTGVEGLAMYFSGGSAPFQEIEEDVISALLEKSNRLDKHINRKLLQSFMQ